MTKLKTSLFSLFAFFIPLLSADQSFTPYGVDIITGKTDLENQVVTFDSAGRVLTVVEPQEKCTFFTYNDHCTLVEDAVGNLTAYHHNNTVVTSIVTYDQQGVQFSKENFQWSEDDQLYLHSFEDRDGKCLKCTRYEYNEGGKLAKETLIGRLTGTDDSNEQYSTHYSWSKDEPAKLLKKWEDNGQYTEFQYDTHGLLVSEISNNGANLHRRFFIRNDLGDLVETILDDGNGPTHEDTQNITHRKRLQFYPSLKQPEMLIEYLYNPETDQEEMIRRVDRRFSDDNQLLYEEFFDKSDTSIGYRSHCYDAFGNCIETLDDKGCGKRGMFDVNGNLLGRAFYQNHQQVDETIYTYDGLKSPAATEKRCDDGTMAQSFHEYDSLGQKIATIDPIGNRTEFHYTPHFQLAAIYYPKILDADDQIYEPSEKWEYDALNRPICYTDMRNDAVKTTYTSRNQPASILYPDATFDLFEYHLDGSLKKMVGRTGLTVEYDLNGAISSSKSVTNENIYLPSLIAPTPNPATEINASDKSSHTITKDPFGQYLLESDSYDKQGNHTHITLDPLGRISSIIKKNCFGETTQNRQFRYDGNGNVTLEKQFVKSPDGEEKVVSTRWYRGPMGRLEKVVEAFLTPEQRTVSYIYDDKGRIGQQVKPDNSSIFYLYNDQNFLERVYSSDKTIDYLLTYVNNQITSVADCVNNQNSVREYDEKGQMTLEMLGNGHSLSWQYDPNGNRISMTIPDGSGFGYDWESDSLKAIKRISKEGSLCYFYELSGDRLNDCMIGDLGKLSIKTDNQNQCLDIVTPFWAETISDSDYDAKGNLCHTLITDQTGSLSTRYEYDNQSRVITESGFFKNSYHYDALGNQYKNNCPAEYNTLCQLVKRDNCTNGFDPNGNRVSKQVGIKQTLYKYDALNRMTDVVKPNGYRYHYNYDYFNRRLSKTAYLNEKPVKTTHYLYDHDCEIGAIDEYGLIKELRMLGIGIGAEIGSTVAVELYGKTFAPIHDSRGSVTALVSLDKKRIVESYRYSSFGEESIQDAKGRTSKQSRAKNPWRFSSKRVDPETGFIYYGKRYYDPKDGRWTTPDPIGFIEGVNRYQFLNNNPVSYVDLYGHYSIKALWCSLCNGSDTLFSIASDNIFALERYILDSLLFETTMKPTIDDWAHAFLSETMLVLLGYHAEEPSVNVFGQGELSDKVRITVINGMLNIKAWAGSNAQLISKTHGDINIHYIHRPTQGWTLDILKSTIVKFGYASQESRILARTWKQMIQEMGGTGGGGLIVHYAHSIGGADTLVARQYLTPEEQKMVRVISLGSPLMIPHGGFHSVINYMSLRDGIFFLAPLSHMSTLFSHSYNVIYLDTYWGVPIIDHLLNRGTYKTLLETLGQEFIQEFLKKDPSPINNDKCLRPKGFVA